MEILSVGDGRRVTVGNERGGPQLEEFVNLSLRKLSVGIRKLRKFKPGPGQKRGPIVICVDNQCFWWGVGDDENAMLITAQACEA